jgi:CheY-like chemotaxis protein
MGIPTHYLPHVFDLFSQAEDSMTREHRGLGLGLAIIKQIVEMHGGGIRVHSEGEGKGAEFMISLPILSKRGDSSPVQPVKQAGKRTVGSKEYPNLQGVHVLIVEDEHDARVVLSASLQHCGARVTGAGTAAEAFDLIRRESPDVLVSDIAMPGEDGFSLIRRIRDLEADEGGEIPAAALTGRAGPEDRTQALKSGFQMYILKPVEPAELAAAVYNLARSKRDV